MVYNILHIEDSKTDADIIHRILNKSDLNFLYRLASDKEELENELITFQPDIILCEHTLPGFNSIMAFEVSREKYPNIPFILVTGSVSEEFAVDIMKKGIDDYLLKTNLKKLPLAIETAVSKKKQNKKLNPSS